MKESEFHGMRGVINGPDSDGEFKITDDDGSHIYVDDEMLVFMIEHRQSKGKSDERNKRI